MEGGQVVDWASLEVLGEQPVKFFDFSVRNAYTHSSI